jgi:hypothetical protein
MFPSVKTYSEFEEYQKKELESFDIDIFNLYDQIIVDHALSGTTGDKVIKNLREHNIFTDVVFYSSNYKKMKEDALKSDQLDGVFYADREELLIVIDRVMKKNLRREYSIPNIRGLIMDGTSEFDFISRTTALALYEKLPENRREAIAAKAKEFVTKARRKSEGNFQKLERLEREKFIKKAMSSVEYIMDNKDRYTLMALVAREFFEEPKLTEDFGEIYQKDLIKPRNELAHNKLYYGQCFKKLHIAKERQKLECSKNCEHCESLYSIERCEELRSLLFEYYILFAEISKNVEQICSE